MKNDLLSSTPLPELERPSKKLCTESGIHKALKKQAEGESVGLMKWFTKQTPEERQTQSKPRQVDAVAEESLKDYEAMVRIETERRKQDMREKNRLRQQRHRQAVCATEITCGIRSPGGTKRKLKVSMVSALDSLLTAKNVRIQWFVF